MALDEFFGCLLTSFGIPGVLLFCTISFYPLRMITFITSSTLWLISLLLSSIIWSAVVPLKDKLAFGLVFSVCFQEAMRFLFIYLLNKVDRGIKVIAHDYQNYKHDHPVNAADPSEMNSISDNRHEVKSTINENNTANNVEPTTSECVASPLMLNNSSETNTGKQSLFHLTTFAYVGGLGFGIMSGLFSSMDLLRALSGPGTLGLKGQRSNFSSIYACQVLFIILSHTSYTVIMSTSYKKKQWIKFPIIVFMHMLSSCLTLANSIGNPAVPIVIAIINACISIASICWALFEVGFRISRFPLVINSSFNYYYKLCLKKRSNMVN